MKEKKLQHPLLSVHNLRGDPPLTTWAVCNAQGSIAQEETELELALRTYCRRPGSGEMTSYKLSGEYKGNLNRGSMVIAPTVHQIHLTGPTGRLRRDGKLWPGTNRRHYST